MVKLCIDNRESNKRINSALNFFIGHHTKADGKYVGKGNVAYTVNLPVGDFVFDDKICFEYKTANDISSSIIDGRVFRQVEKMKQYPFSYVIVVGNVVGTKRFLYSHAKSRICVFKVFQQSPLLFNLLIYLAKEIFTILNYLYV